MDVPPQDVITKDNVSVKVNAVLYFRVVDPNRAVVEVENYLFATSQIAQTTLRSVCGEAELDELLAEREKINAQLQTIIDQQTDPWGIKVVQVEIKHIDLPEEMQRAMARQAEAERERRAKVIAAEGEFQAAQRLAEAAAIMAKQPMALQLRYLQTLAEIATENNSTTIFPVPIDLLRPLLERRAQAAREPACGSHDFDYELPPELIAQEPAPERTAARLLVARSRARRARATRASRTSRRCCAPGDLLVLNDTRVIPARVRGRRPSGGRLEVLFVRPLARRTSGRRWSAARREPGERVHLRRRRAASGSASLGDGRWRLRLDVGRAGARRGSSGVGEVPLPPYIRRPDGPTRGRSRALPDGLRARRRARSRRRPPGCTSRRSCSTALAAARRRARARSRCTSGPGRSCPSADDDLDAHTHARRSGTRSPATRRRAIAARARRRRPRRRGRDDDGARARVGGRRRRGSRPATARPTLFIRPGPPLPRRRRAAHELPPAAHAAARAGRRASPAGSACARRTPRRSRARYRFYSYGDAMLIT